MRALSVRVVVILAFVLSVFTVGGTSTGEVGRSPTSAHDSGDDRPSAASEQSVPKEATLPAPSVQGPPVTAKGSAGPVRSFTPEAPAIALTFDDGPHPRWTPLVLDLLHQYGARATFCMVGSQAKVHPDLVRRVLDEGHALCNHTWSHDMSLPTRPAARIRDELQSTSAVIRAATGGTGPRYYRAPGGVWSAGVVAAASGQGMVSLGWSVDPQDWAKPGIGQIVARVLGAASAGDIVLLHDGGGDRRQTVAALRVLLPELAAQGFAFVVP